MDEETYQKALDVIERARKDPTADRTKLRALVDAVKEHQAAPKPPTTQERPSLLAPEIGGPQGIDMLESKLGTPEANEAQAQAEQAGMSLPRGARTVAGPESIAKNEAAAKARLAEVYDSSLPSASGIKALHRPPEFVPADIGKQGFLLGSRMMMPSYAGGGTQHYAEPTIEQFRRDMGPVIGPRVATMDERSAEYRQYADLLWQRVYDQAKAAGTPVVRHEYAPRSKAMDAIAYHVGNAVDALEGAGEGYIHSASFGAGDAAERLGGDQVALDVQSAGERNPLARAAGSFYGSIKNPILRGIGAFGDAALGPTASVAGGALRAVGHGAVGSAVQSGGEDAVDAATSGQPLDLSQMKTRMVDSAEQGGIAGGLLDLVGHGAGALSAGLRRDPTMGHSVRAVEDAGGTIGGLRGTRPSADMKSAIREAGSEADARALLAERLMGPAAEKGIEQMSTAARENGALRSRYRDAVEKDFVDPSSFTEELANRRIRLEGPNGPMRPDIARTYDSIRDTLPTQQPVPPKLTAAMRASAHEPSVPSEPDALTGPRATPDREGATRVDDATRANDPATDTIATPPGRSTLTPREGGMSAEEAIAKGYDPKKLLEDAGIPEQIAGDFEFFLDHPNQTPPKGLNARQVDLLIDRIDGILKEGKGGKPDPEYTWMAAAARRVRDTLPDRPDILGQRSATVIDPATGKPKPLKGYSAFEANASEDMARRHLQLGLAGVEGMGGIPDANQFKQARGSFASYDGSGSAEDRARMALAEAAGVSGGLKTIGGLAGREELLKRSQFSLEGGGMGGRGQRTVNRLRLSGDPALRNMGMNPDTNNTPYQGLQLRGGAAGRGVAGALRSQQLGFSGPDGNGRSISDQEAGRVKSGVDYYRLMGLL